MTYYTVYRTQNIVNGKYYFGVHKTKNPYDGYLGSGKVLKRAIAKFGEQSFIKNVCFVFDNAEEAFAKEFELIEIYRSDPLCYNLRQGGSGGFDYINREGISGCVEGGRVAQKVLRERLKHDHDLVAKMNSAIAKGRKKWNATDEAKAHRRKTQPLATAAWRIKGHTDVYKAKQAEKMKGNHLRAGIPTPVKVGDFCKVNWAECEWCHGVFLKRRKTTQYCSRTCQAQKKPMPSIKELLELRKTNTYRAIAEVYGVTHPTVLNWFKRMSETMV